jgi:hypothetical protein
VKIEDAEEDRIPLHVLSFFLRVLRVKPPFPACAANRGYASTGCGMARGAVMASGERISASASGVSQSFSRISS